MLNKMPSFNYTDNYRLPSGIDSMPGDKDRGKTVHKKSHNTQ